MSTNKQNKSTTRNPTVITLTVPAPGEDGVRTQQDTTLLIQRGDLAHMRRFEYNFAEDLINAIREANDALTVIEQEPPVIPEKPKPTSKVEPQATAKPAQNPAAAAEPTIDIPLKKGTCPVKISHLKITGSETDAAAYRQAALIAGKLIDGKLWDGKSPIRIDDVYATAKKMKHLTDQDLVLFKLEDFAQAGQPV